VQPNKKKEKRKRKAGAQSESIDTPKMPYLHPNFFGAQQTAWQCAQSHSST